MKQIEEESNQKEKKLVSIIAVKEEKIRILNNRLIELNEVQNCMQMPVYKMEVRIYYNIIIYFLIIILFLFFLYYSL